ncbi:hypothetical protein Clacol_004248 [Clathrus columnatus]|uniref:NAD(P)-binding protein n=1 Tax=Clathrus columnatus TaxID=1419009 RepID=A0AAV5A5Z3_9AGAM|nr:hypothetical protein Clacol_004248 [Clathrus columnatus]
MSTDSVKGAAIITGAAQGVGKAIAIRLAKDGYDVALNDVPGKEDLLRTLADEIISQGRKFIIVIADVTDEGSVVQMIKKTVFELGILRVMVANAGISLTFGSGFIDSNVFCLTFVTLQALIMDPSTEAARQMIQQGTWGRIIGKPHLTSLSFRRNLRKSPGASSINGKRAAEMIKHGITVNAYAPGLIDTPMGKVYPPKNNPTLLMIIIIARESITLEEKNLSKEEKTKRVLQRVSAATGLNIISMGVSEDVASLVSYLASKESKFMTGTYEPVGQTLSVNGGVFFG